MSLELEMRIRDLMDEPEQRALDAKVRRAGILAEVAAGAQHRGDASLLFSTEMSEARAQDAVMDVRYDNFKRARQWLIGSMAYALAAIEAIDADCADEKAPPIDDRSHPSGWTEDDLNDGGMGG